MSLGRMPLDRPAQSATEHSWFASNWGLLLAVAATVAILLLPTQAGLAVAGHRMLAIPVFAVIDWMTEALDYAVSAVVIAALMAFLLGTSRRRPLHQILHPREFRSGRGIDPDRAR